MSALTNEIQQKLDDIQKNVDMPASDQIMAVVKSIMSTIEGELTPLDLKIHAELESLSNFIQATRSEIASLRPSDINLHDIPTATDELSAVVGATEEATGKILDCCNDIQAIASNLDASAQTGLIDIVTKIYEACSFQDITGQRITKVVKTLQHIEHKIDEMLKVLGHDKADKPNGNQKGAAEIMADAKSGEIDEKAHLLNGPQLPQGASTQDEIDRLLASFDN